MVGIDRGLSFSSVSHRGNREAVGTWDKHLLQPALPSGEVLLLVAQTSPLGSPDLCSCILRVPALRGEELLVHLPSAS